MILLARFAVVLALLGLALGFLARRRWGPLVGARPWLVVLAGPVVHAAVVGGRGTVAGVPSASLAAYALATLALVALAAAAARWLRGRRPRASAAVPVAAALVHAAITSALGPAFAAAGAAPPGLGSAGLVAASLVASAAWWVWLPGRPIAPGAAATRSGRLRG